MIALIAMVVLFGSIAWGISRGPSDKCTAADRERGNCVLAGRCTPDDYDGLPLTCTPKNYDSKFDQGVSDKSN